MQSSNTPYMENIEFYIKKKLYLSLILYIISGGNTHPHQID